MFSLITAAYNVCVNRIFMNEFLIGFRSFISVLFGNFLLFPVFQCFFFFLSLVFIFLYFYLFVCSCCTMYFFVFVIVFMRLFQLFLPWLILVIRAYIHTYVCLLISLSSSTLRFTQGVATVDVIRNCISIALNSNLCSTSIE